MEILSTLCCGATLLFGFIQLYQWKIHFQNRKEMDEIWKQIKTLSSSTAKELAKLKSEKTNGQEEKK